MNLEEWKSQLKRGTLEFCILLRIRNGACYGYELMNELHKWPVIAAKESTIYPLLRRLLKEEYLSSFWENAGEGLPPRKYYTLTEKGTRYLKEMSGEWEQLKRAVSSMEGALEHASETGSVPRVG